MIAAREGRESCVKTLLAAHADMDAQSGDGWTALMCAAHYGRGRCVKALVAAGANKEVANKVASAAAAPCREVHPS